MARSQPSPQGRKGAWSTPDLETGWGGSGLWGNQSGPFWPAVRSLGFGNFGGGSVTILIATALPLPNFLTMRSLVGQV